MMITERDDAPHQRLIRIDRIVSPPLPTIEGGAIVQVDGPTIKAIGRAADFAIDVVDGIVHSFDGCSLLPGMVDSHAHLTFDHEQSYEHASQTGELRQHEIARSNAEVHLRSGVTTIRDNGSTSILATRLRAELADRGPRGPRVRVSGSPITVTNGHLSWLGGGVASDVEAVALVRQLAQLGVDHIKIVVSGGGTSGTDPTEPAFSLDSLRRIVDESHRVGKQTAAHCHATRAIEFAVLAGVDCIEHATFLPRGGSLTTRRDRHANLEYVIDARVIELLASSTAFVGFTFAASLAAVDELDDAAHEERLGATERAHRVRRLRRKMQLFADLVESGLGRRLVISSDAGAGTPFGAMQADVELATQSGFAASDAIEAVTSRAAEVIGSGSVGVIRPGASADFLIVKGNPLLQIRALRDVESVFYGGHEIGRGQPEPIRPRN